MTKGNKQGLGTLFDENAMFMCEQVGTAGDGDKQYQMLISPSGAPMIRSVTTGKTFAFNWHELIYHAVEQGIDNQGSKDEPHTSK